MNKKVAFLFPGQGAQYVGMGRDFFEAYPKARAVFEEADRLLNFPLSQLIFDGPAEELTLTKNSQVAIFVTSVALLRVLQEEHPDLIPTSCAGLSLGEYTALVASGKLSFQEALLLVKARGEYMQKACETHPGTMHVVLGLEPQTVEEALKGVEGVWVANLNCPGQVVISGTKDGVEKGGEILKEKGARRVMPLEVSGAFHSGLMQEAQDKLDLLIQKVSLQETPTEIVMNVYGAPVESEQEMRKGMTHQVTHPVYWQKGIEALVGQGVELFIEIGPGKTLAGMNKRIGVPGVTVSIEKIEDLKGVINAPIA